MTRKGGMSLPLRASRQVRDNGFRLRRLIPLLVISSALFALVATPLSVHASGSNLLNGLQAYWKFDDGSGSSVSDATGNGNTGTWNGTLGSQWTSGKVNGAGNFDGTSNYVNVPDSSSLDSTTQGVTVAAWIKPTDTASSHVIVDKNSLTGYMFTQSTQIIFASAGNYDLCLTPGNTIVATGVWYYVVATYDLNTCNVYVNGVLKGSNTQSGNITPGVGALELGSRFGSSYESGGVDELGIWNRALSANEVTDLYNAGNGNQYPFPALTTDTVTITAGTLGFGTAGVASNVTSTQAFGAQTLSGMDITDNGSSFQVDMNDARGSGNGWKVAAETTANFAHSGTTVSGLLPTFEASPGAVACDTGAGHCTTSSGACISGVTYPVTLTTSSYLSIWDANNTSDCGMGSQTATWTSGSSTGFELVIPANVNLNGQSGLALTATETFQNASGP